MIASRACGVAAGIQRRPVVEAALGVGPEHGPDDLVLLQQHPNGLGLVDAGLFAVAAGILAERALEVLRDADVVHHQPGRLVAEHAVDAGDGLHQPVALHRLVHVHRVHAGRVEAGQPHVAHDHQLERVARVLGALGEQFPPRLWPLADMRLPRRRIGRRAGHHHLDRAGLVVIAVPLRAQLHDGVVERHADAPAHADDHRLAVERRHAVLEMLHEVCGDQREALFGADQRLDARPFALEPLLLALPPRPRSARRSRRRSSASRPRRVRSAPAGSRSRSARSRRPRPRG